MDPSLYNAVQQGNLNAITEKKELVCTTQLTPNKNTLLHVAAQFNDSQKFALEILMINESLLCEANSDGETALHVAARSGRQNVGIAMMEFAKRLDGELEAGGEALKKLLTWKNRNGDTALHEAIRNDQPNMVLLLIQNDPELANIANNALETPLFLAVDVNPDDENRKMCVNHILENCSSPAYTGPNRNTVLHAAALYDWKRISEKLLKKHPTIITEVNDFGWSALHFAAQRGSNEVAEELLKADKSIAYIVAEKDYNRTALHIATCYGKVKIMEEILAYCPDCWEMVVGNGQNILHLSVAFEQQESFKFIMKKSWVGYLINQKDEEGNTPLHEYAAAPNYFYGYDLVNHPQVKKNAVNKEYKTPLDVNAVQKELKENHASLGIVNEVNLENYWRLQMKNPENKRMVPADIRKAADTHMVVAALITTVAFAAGFTIPGGYGNDGPNEGMAILSRKAAFKAFIITDTLAVVCSASAIFLHFIGASFTDKLKLVHSYLAGALLVIVAMGAMVIAFMTGLYTVLEQSLEIAIIECVICSFCFPIFYY
ncbi:protein ACCELERATED CELL DEATH 6-like isoform X2 [Olea europaea var. sylvestris]|uniref:protein ACCELERATED CELL DEATH 6-like isoform X2 n=1 Tax=Olea europaea var. sylvestris TaxID=158386 RepID=UPI000C1D84BC|nr:protein ACCELERATED CELL DEATH 6-like isoform X2 [Olea europaea var. sylvestris]